MDENELLQNGLLDDDPLVGTVLIDPGPGLPQIVVNNRQLRDISGDAWAAIRDSPFFELLYIYDGQLIKLNQEHRIQVVDAMLLTAILNRSADWVAEYEGGYRDARLPRAVPLDMLALPPAGFFELKGVTHILSLIHI